MASSFVKTWSYTEHEEQLKSFTGRNILIYSDESTVVVFQAFCSDIAEYAVTRGFFGGQQIDFDRTTWLKLSFLWTMKKSKWAVKSGQERVLALRIDKTFFIDVIDLAASTGIIYQKPPGRVDSDAVSLQWVPDYDVHGEKLERFTMLVGLRGYMMRKLNNTNIIDIADITDFVTEQYSSLQCNDYNGLLVPMMGQLVPPNEDTCRDIMLHGFYESHTGGKLASIVEIESLRKSKKPRREVALYFQGSFNPVHTHHLKIMHECKTWLEKKANKKVIIGLMDVNPHKRLNDKIDKIENGEGLVITEEHRLEMCRLAGLSDDWIYVQIHDRGPTLSDNLKQIVGNHIEWFYIMGADKVVGRDISKMTHVLIIGRKGVNIQVSNDRVEAAIKRDVNFIPIELENVSSTEIRHAFKRMLCMDTREEKQEIIDELVEKGWLDANVGEYVLDNENDLHDYSTA